MFLCDNDNQGRNLDFDVVWEFLPASAATMIVIMCFNALKPNIIHSNSLINVPSNIVLVDYGFQVSCLLFAPNFNFDNYLCF